MQHSMKRAAVAALSTGVLLAGAVAPASAADRNLTLGSDATATWSNGGTGSYLTYPLLACETVTPLDACDATILTVTPDPEKGPSTLTLSMTPNAATDDFDLYAYRDADGDGTPEGDNITDGKGQTGLGPGEAETLTIPDAAGTYLIEIPYFISLEGGFTATATTVSSGATTSARGARSGGTIATRLLAGAR